MRIISFALGAALVCVPVTATAESPLQKETSVWQAFKDKKANAFGAMLAPNFVALYDEGTVTRDHELDALKNSKLGSFKFSNFASRMIDANNMLMTYSVEVKGMNGKQDVSGLYHASSVWHRAGKNWVAVYHSEVKAK
jgi:hypothetical protein